jgi:hypothetical protein
MKLLSKDLDHVIPIKMTSDQIQVFATPEAYELIESNARGSEFFAPVREAIKLALGQRERCGGSSSAASPLGFWARWNYKKDGTSIILIHITDYGIVIPFDNTFDEILENSVPIQIA